MGDLVVEVRGLVKQYGRGVTAVDGLDLSIERGETYGLLGPNGAGKTTTMRMLLGPGAAHVGLSPGEPGCLRRLGAMGEAAFHPFLSGRDNARAAARRAGVGDGRVDEVGDLGRDGRTIVLSSHDLDEVERLCGRVGVIGGAGPVGARRRADARTDPPRCPRRTRRALRRRPRRHAEPRGPRRSGVRPAGRAAAALHQLARPGRSRWPGLRELEGHGDCLADDDINDFETMVVEAIRPPSDAPVAGAREGATGA